ncbi:hypothetical protein EDEG_00685 [Edhazardia aedis USNM 41457]|uniref:mRNA triphosphatase Cet1-like domain-containing protein n=1 Tax=Edhazardia aedis (strain USNM 41457) TaxID=1003232 RepID=J9DRM7_EDHAE|nr:hypothetical protein EDEG_00685 [Edhazardia aedis USNM 41457]|eukprot:EJW05220.1 hypothetical protein EDEG_00685 [Edhazardia aedis USNM 41457]
MSDVLSLFENDRIKTLKKCFFDSIHDIKSETCTIEIYFGEYRNLFTGKRIQIPSMNPVIYVDNEKNKLKFYPYIEKDKFDEVFQKINRDRDFFSIINQKMYIYTDFMYMQEDEKNEGYMFKRKQISSFSTFFPERDYDIRISAIESLYFEEIKFNKYTKKYLVSLDQTIKRILIDEFKFDFITLRNSNKSDIYQIRISCKNKDFDEKKFFQIVFGKI